MILVTSGSGRNPAKVPVMDAKQQQEELVFQIVEMFAPLRKVAANFDGFDRKERSRIRAQYFHDKDKLVGVVGNFLTTGVPGCSFTIEYKQFLKAVYRYDNQASEEGMTEQHWFSESESVRRKCVDSLADLPIYPGSVVGDNQSRFATYTQLKAISTAVTKTLWWQDRYFDSTVFHRYFVDVPEHVQITLVTWPQAKWTSPKDEQRFAAFIDASEMFAEDRGLNGYRLITSTDDLHARRLIADTEPYSLDHSAQSQATMSIHPMTGEAKRDAIKDMADRITAGVELFGPSQQVHPKATWEVPQGGSRLRLVLK